MAAPSNYIGQLQEMAQFSRWQLPVYEETEKLDDEPVGYFVMLVRVLDMTARGYATTKKAARQQAAKAMLQQIRDTGVHVAVDSKSGQRVLPV